MTQTMERRREAQVQKLSETLAKQLMAKILIVKGRFCLRGDEANPLAIMAEGKRGKRGRAGKDTGVKRAEIKDMQARLKRLERRAG